MIVHPDNIKAVKRFGLNHEFKVCTGAQYIDIFIGGDKSKRDLLEERTKTWERNITNISETSSQHH